MTDQPEPKVDSFGRLLPNGKSRSRSRSPASRSSSRERYRRSESPQVEPAPKPVSAAEKAAFFDAHNEEEWFQEKYHPLRIHAQLTAAIGQYKVRYQQFQARFQADGLEFINQNVSGTEQKKLPFMNNCVRLGPVSPSCPRSTLETLFAEIPGYEGLALSEPNSTKGFRRQGWIYYTNQESCERAMLLNGKRVEEHTFNIRLKAHKKLASKHRAPAVSHLDEARVALDLARAIQVAQFLDVRHHIDSNFLFQTSPTGSSFLESHQPALRQLNVVLEYLRRVHYFCYYCGVSHPNMDSLFAACGEAHLREAESTEGSEKWIQKLDESIASFLASPNTALAPPAGISGMQLDQQAHPVAHRHFEAFFESIIVQKSKGKFSCPYCVKLFKSPKFVKLHINNKHREYIVQQEKKAFFPEFKDNFFADPTAMSMLQVVAARSPSPARRRNSRSPSPRRRSLSRSRSRHRSRTRSPDHRTRSGRGRGPDRRGGPPPRDWSSNSWRGRGGPPFGRGHGGFRPRGSRGSGRERDSGYISFGRDRVPAHAKPPALDLQSSDGRSLRSYADLDAPADKSGGGIDYGLESLLD